MILVNSRQTFQTLEEEYEIQTPVLLRNRIAVIIRTIKQKYRTTMATTAQLYENVSTLQSLVRSKPTGCNPATRLILRSQRDSWEWGETPRSHSTYTRGNYKHKFSARLRICTLFVKFSKGWLPHVCLGSGPAGLRPFGPKPNRPRLGDTTWP